MSRRLPPWLPWAVCALAVVLGVAAAVVAHQAREPGGGVAASPLAGLPSLVGTAAIGALLAARLPGNPYGWVVVGCPLASSCADLADGLLSTTELPPSLLAVAEAVAYLVFYILFLLVFVLFPTGRLPGPRWRWFPRTAVGLALAAMVTVLFAPRTAEDRRSGPWATAGAAGRVWDVLFEAVTLALLALAVPAAVAVVSRFRRASAVERQQLKWLVVAGVAVALIVVLDVVGLSLLLPDAVGLVLDQVAFLLVPLAIGLAVLRYRLYEIDRIVSRTVSYVVLTAGLLALYVVVVTAMRQVLEPVTGSTDLAVAASTLAVAAAFRPARRRVQAVVDRRFDRARYDATRTVDAYARRLRSEVDPEAVTAGLRETVAATMGPQRVTLWLRGSRPAGER